LLRAISITIFYLAWGLAVTHFPFVLFASTKTMHLTIKNETRIPGGACGLIMVSNTSSVLMKTPQIGGFIEGQLKIKSPAWSGKTTDGLVAGPLDCHKRARIKTYEDASYTTDHPCFM